MVSGLIALAVGGGGGGACFASLPSECREALVRPHGSIRLDIPSSVREPQQYVPSTTVSGDVDYISFVYSYLN